MLALIHQLISHVDILDDVFYFALFLLLTMYQNNEPKQLIELLNIQSNFLSIQQQSLKNRSPQHRRQIKTDLKLPSFQ